MKVVISKDKTKKFTNEAQLSLNKHILKFVDKVCEEAERIEINRCKSLSQVQITPHTVERAVDYVIEERVEKIRHHWFPAIVCPFIDCLSGIGLSYGIEHYDTSIWPAIISIVILFSTLIYQLTYHFMSK